MARDDVENLPDPGRYSGVEPDRVKKLPEAEHVAYQADTVASLCAAVFSSQPGSLSEPHLRPCAMKEPDRMSQHSRPPSDDLEIVTTDHGGVIAVAVIGEIDEFTVDPMAVALTAQLDARPAALVIDLSAVSFIASAGLRVLASAYVQAHRYDLSMCLVTTQRAVLRVLSITALDSVFTVTATVPEALDAVRRPN